MSERIKVSDLYTIKNGNVEYNYYGRIFKRSICKEIQQLLTTKRKIKYKGEYRWKVFLFENELVSINEYITSKNEFKLKPYYPLGQEIVRAINY